jgi:glycine oxidase
MRTSEVLVVGGGVVGASTAFFLAREGIEVTLLERSALASGASGAAAGMLTPFSEASGPGPFLTWATRSLAGFESLAAELLERSGMDCEWVRSGTLRLVFDAEEAELQRDRMARLGDIGRLEWLDAAAVRSREPAISESVVGAVWSPDEAHVRSPLLARSYAAAARRLGARIETGVEVASLCIEDGRVAGVETAAGAWSTPRVVLCTGAWSGGGGLWPGGIRPPPIEPVRGQILSLAAPTPSFRAMIWGAGGYLVSKRDGSVVVGATEEHVGFDARVTAAGMHHLLGLAPRLVPGLSGCTFRSAWAGLRPGSPDGLPLVGPVPGIEGLALAAGHHRSGVLLSPVTGRLVADWVAGKGIPEEAAAFLPSRFLSDA